MTRRMLLCGTSVCGAVIAAAGAGGAGWRPARAPSAAAGAGRRPAAPPLWRRLDIGLHDAPVRAAAGRRRRVDAGLLGHAARQRGGEDAVARRAAWPWRGAAGAGAGARGAGGGRRRRRRAGAAGPRLPGPARPGGGRAAPPRPPPAARRSARSPSRPAVPSGTRIRPSTPSSTASTSIVALSVSISAMTSPALTASPSFLCHLASLPSVMVGRQRRHQDVGSASVALPLSDTDGLDGGDDVRRAAAAPASRDWRHRASARPCPCTRTGGASSQSKACSITCAAISAPMPAKGQPSSTRDEAVGLLAPLATMVSMSSGRSVRRSITSAAMPSLGQRLGRFQRHADHDARRRRW